MKIVYPLCTLILFLFAFATGCTSSDDEDPTPVAAGFFDDFSVDSLRLTVDRRADESVSRDYQVENDRIVIHASSTNGERAQAYIDPWGRSDSITARIALSSESVLPDDDEARAVARITGTFYNDTGESDRIQAIMELASSSTFTGDQQTDDNAIRMRLGGTFYNDTPYAVSITVDRTAGTMVFVANDAERQFDIPTIAFAPPEEQFINVQARSANGSTAVAYVDDFGTSADAQLEGQLSSAFR